MNKQQIIQHLREQWKLNVNNYDAVRDKPDADPEQVAFWQGMAHALYQVLFEIGKGKK